MFYYAVLNENDICTEVITMPVQISGEQIVAVSSNDQSYIGKHYNRAIEDFEMVYYYAILNDK